MAVAKRGCGQMGHLTPLNCKPSEHSVREAFNKDRLAVIMEHLFCTVWCASRWRPRGACVENDLENRGEREGKDYQISASGFLADFSSECLGVTHYWEVSDKEREKKRERRSHLDE